MADDDNSFSDGFDDGFAIGDVVGGIFVKCGIARKHHTASIFHNVSATAYRPATGSGVMNGTATDIFTPGQRTGASNGIL